MEDGVQWEGPHTGAGEEHEDSSPGKEVATEATCEELTTVPFPIRWERGGREIRSEVKPGQKGNVGGKSSKI